MTRKTTHRSIRRLVAALAGFVLVGGALAAPAQASTTTLPTPTLIASAVTSSVSAPCGPPACAVPAVLVAMGAPFSLTVTLTASGAPAAFKTNTTLTLSAPGPGTLSPASIVMPGGESSHTFAGLSYSMYANGVTVTAAQSGKKGATASASNAFDVLQTLKTDNASPHTALQDGAGPGDCAVVSTANPVCGVVVLPNGANSNVLLSTGSCVNIGCNVKGTVTQVIADLSSQPLYTPSAPAQLIIKCYRTVCGQGGVNKYTAAASLSATGALVTVPACPAKGTLGSTQSFCTDYVSSTRTNADELDLIVLFDQDFRGSIG